ncbi:MAG: M43 family zinc metalloprotease [Chitinophagales bacterium]
MKSFLCVLSVLLFINLSCNDRIIRYFLTSEQVVSSLPTSIEENSNQQVTTRKAASNNRKICGDQLNYAPDTSYIDHTPMRWVRVNFHFVDSKAGGINFGEEEGVAFSHELLKVCNERMLTNAKMHLPKGNETPIVPPRYQFVLAGKHANDDGIYFHNNDSLFVFNKKRGRGSLFSREQYNVLGTRKGEVINVFFLEHHPDSIASKTYKASSDGVGYYDWAKVGGSYQIWQERKEKYKNWTCLSEFISGIFNHELGHSLGLAHTWAGNDGCDDTPKNANCWYPDKNWEACNSIEKVSNNMMDYNAWRNALTPCQIGRVHKRMATPKSKQRKKLDPVWCVYKPEAKIVIPKGARITWLGAKDLEGDLVIEKNAKLTIHCTISLPKKAKIIVKPGGTLALNGAKLTNLCGEKWQGIEVEQQGNIRGRVEMVSESTIENAVNGGF